MAIEKFRFVSPGVQVQEIDDSRLPAQPAGVGPVVIGRTLRGPGMQPVQVSSIQQLEAVFGAPVNGNSTGVDVWRSGLPSAPTFASYAAKAYLQNAGPVTVVRLLGVDASSTVEAGWSITQVTGNTNPTANAGAFGLFVNSGSETTGTLAAVFYCTQSTPYVSQSVLGYTTGSAAAVGSSLKIKISGSGAESEVVFDPTNPKFIRGVFNTDPTKLSASKYFLGETFEKGINAITNGTITSASIVPLSASYSAYKLENASAKSGWIVSQAILPAGSFTASAVDGTYPVKKLFRLVALNGGSWEQSGVKISIENIKSASQSTVYPYGSFDVVVRSLVETAANTTIERFNGCTLDPDSPNYIAKVIGDSYRVWSSTHNRLEEFGQYPNNSSIFRVEISTDYTPSAGDLPYGFYGPESFLSSEVNTKVAATASIGFQKVELPQVSLLTETLSATAAKTRRFGFVSTSSQTDLVDLLRYSPATDTGKYAFMFSLHNISGSDSAGYTYGPTKYFTGDGTSDPHTKVLGFDVPVYGGLNGWDITQKEPVISEAVLGTSDGTFTNYAYATIKRAIDMVADPELVDMDVLCVPGVKNKFLTQYMIDKCKERGDAIAIIDLEGDLKQTFEGATSAAGEISSVSSVVTALNTRAIDNSYGAAYFPAVFVGSEGIYMPASVAALGAYGGTRGRSAVWFAPAGFNRGGLTQLNSGIGVTRTRLHLNSSDRDALYAANINPIAQFPSEGVVIFGQKTLQTTPSALDRVNVRRMVNFVKRNISTAARATLFEPNVEETWNNFKAVVNPFLASIVSNYGLDDALVVLDSRTTTADLVDRNIMYAKILLKPTRAIEFIGIDFVITNSGAVFTE